MNIVALVILLFGFVNISGGAKILGLFHFPSKSHHVITSALFRELAERGHQVTMISPFPFDEKIANFTDINLDGLLKIKEEKMDKITTDDNQTFEKMKAMSQFVDEATIATFESKAVADLLASGEKFDVMISTLIMAESFLGIAHRLDVPVIFFMPQGTNTGINSLFGNSGPYSYVPNPMLALRDEMTFLERMKNTMLNTGLDIYLNLYGVPKQQALLEKYFPDAPPLDVLVKRVALGLFASSPAIESARPYMPNMIQVGGLHLDRKNDEKIDPEIKKVLDGATKHGVIFFSFGSNVKAEDLSQEKINEFVKAFASMKETILWKYEGEIKDKPKNVVAGKWLPQRAILGHPNVKAFLTHGGLGSLTEAVYNGVPMVCIPFFADQFGNCHDSFLKGYAIHINLNEMNAENIATAIKEVITNPKYKQSIKSRSDLFREQPIIALDKAVFWVEHVAKYHGADHLRSAAVKLSWYQFMLLDVIGFVLLILVAVYYLLCFILRRCYRFIKSRLCKSFSGCNNQKKKKQ